MTKLILPTLIGLLPLLILWLSGHDLSRSVHLAAAAIASFVLAICTLVIMVVYEKDIKK